MLLQKADTLSKLSIKSLVEWRVWLELKRIKRELTVEIDSNRLRQTTKVASFQGGEIKVEVRQEQIWFITEDNEEAMDLDDFIRQPRQLINKLFT
jgi:hypothetical protein